MSDEEKEKQPERPDAKAESPSRDGESKAPAAEGQGEPAAAKPKARKAPAKPAGAKAAPRRPAPKTLSYEDLEGDDLLNRLRKRFQEGVISGQSFLDQPVYTVSTDCLYDVMVYLCDPEECGYDYLVDLTALDYLGDEKRFCMVYHLYSHRHNQLIRVRSRVGEGEAVPSVTSIWRVADWMEREVFDMFGIDFSGHGDLKRILLPDDWHGHPLRKDYDIKLQDQAWIRKHLQIRKTP